MILVDNVTRFEEFKSTPEYERQKYELRLVSKWLTRIPYNMLKIFCLVYYSLENNKYRND